MCYHNSHKIRPLYKMLSVRWYWRCASFSMHVGILNIAS